MKYVFAAVLFIVTAAFPTAAAEGVRRGLEICSSMVIPSLFPLMFCSLLFMRTGLAGMLSKPFAKPAARLLKLPECAGFVLLAAMCGGYPAGAAAVKEYYDNGELSGKQAERLSYFAFSAGPAFVLGAVGGVIYKNTRTGVMLLLVLCLSVLIVGTVLSLFSIRENTVKDSKAKAYYDNPFVSSAVSAAKSLLSVCVFVMLFAYFMSIIQAVGADRLLSGILVKFGVAESTAKAFLPCILEVSGGCIAASEAGFPMVAFALGFGGLSVHFQVFSVLEGVPVSKVKFIIIRLLQGIICAVLTAFISSLLPASETAAMAFVGGYSAMPTATGSVCLVIMCLMAVMCLPEPLTKGKKRV